MTVETKKMIDFVQSIGITVDFGIIPPEKEFVPGVCIHHGGLLIDTDSLKYPGDILHEAGHLAVVSAENRKKMDGILTNDHNEAPAEEMTAIAWSYAAAVYLNIDPKIVFHEFGYNGGGGYIADNFAMKNYFGVPMLQWLGFTKDEKNAAAEGVPAYPHMLKWLGT
jgi:hypothetical protein